MDGIVAAWLALVACFAPMALLAFAGEKYLEWRDKRWVRK